MIAVSFPFILLFFLLMFGFFGGVALHGNAKVVSVLLFIGMIFAVAGLFGIRQVRRDFGPGVTYSGLNTYPPPANVVLPDPPLVPPRLDVEPPLQVTPQAAPRLAGPTDVNVQDSDGAPAAHPPTTMASETPLSVFEQTFAQDLSTSTRRHSGPGAKVPEWVVAGDSSALTGEPTRVFSSDRYATLEEAEAALLPQVQAALSQALQTQLGRPVQAQVSQNDLRQYRALRRQAITEWPLQVGEFQETMQQLHWEVSFAPHVLKSLASHSGELVKEQHLLLALLACGGATALFACGAFLCRTTESKLDDSRAMPVST